MSPKGKPSSRRPAPLILGGVAVVIVLLLVWSRRTPQSTPTPGGATNQIVASAPKARPDAEVFGRYAGSQSCRECHAEAFAAWEKSHHGLAERHIDLARDQAAFDPPRTIPHGTQTSRVRLNAGQPELLTPGTDKEARAFTPERVIGVAPLRQFLVPAEGGRFQVTELAYDPRRGDWFDIFGDEDRQPGEWGHWTGRGMNWNQMCASCHNTRLRKHYDANTDAYATTMVEMSVGCESCHGPMAEHVKWQQPRAQPAKGDPTLRKFAPSITMSACGACHARRSELTGEFEAGDAFLDHFLLTIPDETDLYFPDGQVRDENYEYASFLSSGMFTKGVTCMDCHEPHTAKVKASDNSLCLRCHEAPLPPAPRIIAATHTFHPPGKEGSRCVDCHMPVTTYMQRHPRRDHGFTIPDPLLTKEHGIPNACNRCHQDKDVDWSIAAVEKWYGPRMERPTRARARTMARARNGDTNALPHLLQLAHSESNGLWRAAATRMLGMYPTLPGVQQELGSRAGDANPLVRAAAARALAPFVDSGESGAISSLNRLFEDERRAVRFEASWSLHARLDTNSPAGRELLHTLLFNADQPGGAAQYGSFLLNRGDPSSALPWFQRAVLWDAYSAPLRDGLAVCLSAVGRSAEAVMELEAACRLAPRDAQYPYKLGLALNETGQLPRAVAALEKAVQLDPEFAAAWYNLGLGYAQLNRLEESLHALVRAESLDPASARIPYARATVLAQMERTEEARQAAFRALEIERDFSAAQQLLEALSR